jgi:hypothetical protein
VTPPTGPRRSTVDGTTVWARPTRYVDEDPVIRRIGDRDIYLGNVHAADGDRHDRSFDRVVSVNSEPGSLTTHHRPLSDDDENEWAAFAAAVDAARRAYRAKGAALVNCTAGVSRSSAVLATAVAAEEARTFLDALDEILETRPTATPHPGLQFQGVVYLAARSDAPPE